MRELDNALRHHQAGRLVEAEKAYRNILKRHPDHADSLHLLGLIAHATGHNEEAIRLIRRAIEVNKSNSIYHTNLGVICGEQGHFDLAVMLYKHALLLKPENNDAMTNLGNAYQTSGNFVEAETCYRQVLERDPRHALAHYNLGMSLQAQGHYNDAMRSFSHAITARPDYADAHLALGIVQLLTGDFAQGWPNFEWRWLVSQFKRGVRNFAQPQWRGEPLDGRRILLHSEQGLGDSIQFLRYVTMVQAAGGIVLLEVQAALLRMAHQIPGITAVIPFGNPLPDFDLHCPLMSLALAFQTTLNTIPVHVPYLHVPVDAQARALLRPWTSDRIRVGLAWAGSKDHVKDKSRSISFAVLRQLIRVSDISFFSLQLGEQLGAEDLENMVDLASETDDLADTAAQMKHLDLIISVDTSIAHLAGALGKPVWILLHCDADWRWLLARDDSAWYPTARLFRQTDPGNWTGVIERVATELQRLFARDTAETPGRTDDCEN
ncbi:Flp pilus assembly protein TadD [Granulicella aggregans]|uniref:Flp pilus assembly protein TadD n=1 Tax=Granulicella aggregans TaxID=474949 RepID=A0A7W8E775_9BACT|nr:tetratricopeptide repeat-containing glycosyltransferase family protein [Granulicella aggregans]MBB5061412.1 Flp pilus assembly protein TadD [Granulicella aggregans]